MVIRKYTPPTCTLEIKAKESPLSRWAGQTVLKQLHFELRFDDPRQPEEKRVTIWGNRSELEALYEAVTTYVQDFLNQSPAPIPVGSFESTLPTSESLLSPLPPDGGKRAEENLKLLPFRLRDGHRSTTLSASVPLPNSPSIFYLQPRGLLTHELFLGPLETEASGPFVALSALQLFDLATALDEFAAEAVALPQLNRPSWLQSPPPWMKATAMVVLTVGLTTATVKLLDRVGNNPQNTAKAPSPASSPAPQTPVLAQAPTVPPPPVAPPTPITSLGTTRASSGAPLLNTPKRLLPPPSISVLPQPRTGSQPTFVIPETGTTPSRSEVSPRRLGVSPTPIPRTALSQSSYGRPPAKPDSAPPQQPKVAKSQGQPAVASAPTPPPTIPSPPSLGSYHRQQGGELQEHLPQLNASPPVPPVPTSPTYSSDPPSRRSGAIADSAPSGRLFDTNPQVAKVRSYFQQRWKPPEEVTQPLEYDLVLNGNGSIDRIIPRSAAAATYLNRTNMPTPGQPFVSATDKGSVPTIRLVLYPDGRVETFSIPN